MRSTSYVSALDTIAAFNGHRQDEVLQLFERIMELPGDPSAWESVFAVSIDAQLEFYPWGLVSNGDEIDPPTGIAEYGLPETFVHHAATLSQTDWFNCSADQWLRVVAADVLAAALGNYTLVKMALDQSDQANKDELTGYLPGMVKRAITEARVFLTAADAMHGQSKQLQSDRQQQVRAAAKRKNYRFVELHSEFFEYFLHHQGGGKSRAQLAREFAEMLIERFGSERNLPFLNRETAQRSLLDNLRKRLADDTTA